MITVGVSLGSLCMSQGLCCLLSSDGRGPIRATAGLPSFFQGQKGMHHDVLIVDFPVLSNDLPVRPQGIKILLLDTGCGDDNIFYALIARNISGVVSQDADADQLRKAVVAVASGELWLDRKTIRGLLSRLSRLADFWRLTDEETEMLHLMSRGLDNEEISELLGTDVNRVSSAIDRLKIKMRAKDRGEMILLSMQFDKFDEQHLP